MKVKDILEELCYGELSGTSLLVLDAPKLTDSALRRVIVAINDAMTELAYEIPYYTRSVTFKFKGDHIVMPEDMRDTYTQILQATLTAKNVIDCNINVDGGEFRSPTIFIDEAFRIRIGGVHLDDNTEKMLTITYACTPPLLDVKRAKNYLRENDDTTLMLPRSLGVILKIAVASKALLNSGSAEGVQLAQVYAQKYTAMLQQIVTKDLVNTSKVHNPNYLKRYGFL